MNSPAAVCDLPDERGYELACERRARRKPAWDEPVSEVEVRVAERLDVETERAIGEPDDLGMLPELVVEFHPQNEASKTLWGFGGSGEESPCHPCATGSGGETELHPRPTTVAKQDTAPRSTLTTPLRPLNLERVLEQTTSK